VPTAIERIDLKQKLALFDEAWAPRIVAEVADCEVKLAKLDGEFVWHRHEREDELFLVLAGRLRMRFREREVELSPGQLIVVPRGVEHLPVGLDGCAVLLVEPKGTLNTGDASDPRTLPRPERI
jgi:mannose-6-phosphate isomerase-like protein (cupin superfamily)